MMMGQEVRVILAERQRIRFEREEALLEQRRYLEKKAVAQSLAAEANPFAVALPEVAPRYARSLESAFVESGGVVSTKKGKWDTFWQDKPRHVGIDAEGTHLSPPLLVQVAWGSNSVLLETGGKLSFNMRKLLADESIVKIFFGPPQNENFPAQTILASCFDVQRAIADRGDDPKQLPSLTTAAERLRVFGSDTIKKNLTLRKMFHRFRTRPTHQAWLNHNIQLYSAADAWCTLRLYQALLARPPSSGLDSTVLAVLTRSW